MRVCLRLYLDYAERGADALRGGITEDSNRAFDSPFEQEVQEELTRHGLKVHRQVGCSRFRIDLAVVDSLAPGRYLLGVECDGATYHSSATARDRDRLRQDVLEDLGWRICRIWSTDWVRDRLGQVERVMAALKLQQDDSTLVRSPPLPVPKRENHPPEGAHQPRTTNEGSLVSDIRRRASELRAAWQDKSNAENQPVTGSALQTGQAVVRLAEPETTRASQRHVWNGR